MKKNIIKAVIAMIFVVGAIVRFNVEVKAYMDLPSSNNCSSKISCDEIAMTTYNKCTDTYACCDFTNSNVRGCKQQ